MILCAELATGHGGDVALAGDMIRAAADAGCDLAKLQTYDLAKLNPSDPQRDWLIQSHLSEAAHEQLLKVGQQVGIEVFSTPFDADSLAMLRRLGLKRFKIASSESGNGWWDPTPRELWIVSYPWGRTTVEPMPSRRFRRLTAIPLYPTPLECVGHAPLLDGYSDHTVGIDVCLWAIAKGAEMIEKHMTIPGAREKPWDASPAQFRQLRDFADSVSTMTTGVATQFRNRWNVA